MNLFFYRIQVKAVKLRFWKMNHLWPHQRSRRSHSPAP